MSVFSTKTVTLIPTGVRLDLESQVEIESVVVTIYPNGGSSHIRYKKVEAGGNSFHQTVSLPHGGRTVKHLTVIANLTNGESENMHAEAPSLDQMQILETEGGGPSSDLGCGPDGCEPG